MVHQDAEVVTEVCAGDTERPHACKYEDISAGKEGSGDGKCERRVGEEGIAWLVAETALEAVSC